MPSSDEHFHSAWMRVSGTSGDFFADFLGVTFLVCASVTLAVTRIAHARANATNLMLPSITTRFAPQNRYEILKRPTRGASTFVGDIHDAMLWVGAAGSPAGRIDDSPVVERIAKVVLAFVTL